MCGFCGILRTSDRPVDIRWLRNATSKLRHRGPDDEGYLLVNFHENRWVSCGGSDTDHHLRLPDIRDFEGQEFDFALGFRRLSIIELSSAGHQPMSDASGSTWVVSNGEIYNFLELRQTLQHLGYQFRSSSDTEVLLNAYKEWGMGALNHLSGMFACAILDLDTHHLFLARDFFGIKPLYITSSAAWFTFASEIKSLLEFPFIQRAVDPQSLYNYLKTGWTDTGPQTMLRDISQIQGAHYLDVDLQHPEQIRPARYWQINLQEKCELSFEAAAEKMRYLFLESVQLHLRSDVPVGIALSGGIDSSAIASVVKQVNKRQGEVHAFSFIADDPIVNEERWMEIAGADLGVIHHKVQPLPQDLIHDLDALVYTQDEPFISASMYAQNRVFRLVGESGIKVTLDGQGADELLAGYIPLISFRLASLLRKGDVHQAVQLFQSTRGMPGIRTSDLLIGILDHTLPAGLRRMGRRVVGKDQTPSWMTSDWFRQRNVAPQPAFIPQSTDILRENLHRLTTETSLPLLLRYEDRNSMAYSVESRVPFLTPDLAQFVFSLPEEYLIQRDGTTKAIFRAAMKGIVPQTILERRDKIGFVPPERAWLLSQKEWVENNLRSETAAAIPVVHHDQMLLRWQHLQASPQLGADILWRWINLIRWVECFAVDFN